MLRLIQAAATRIVACVAIMTLASTVVAAEEHSNVALAKGIYAAFEKGDAAAILAAVSPNVRWEVVGRQSDCACMGVRTGKAGVEDFLKVVGAMYTFKEMTIRGFYVSGDKVFVLGHYAATNKITEELRFRLDSRPYVRRRQAGFLP